MKEAWKDIKDYEGLYQVSNTGKIKSIDRYVNYKLNKKRLIKGSIKKLTLNEKGYLKVTLFKNGKGCTREIQRIVAETFIPNLDNKEQVNHIDGNKQNNNINNLEWCSPRENTIHSINVLEHYKKPVIQFDLKGKYVNAYMSIKEAGEKNNIRPCSISNCINGRRLTAGGYQWALA